MWPSIYLVLGVSTYVMAVMFLLLFLGVSFRFLTTAIMAICLASAFYVIAATGMPPFIPPAIPTQPAYCGDRQ